MVDYPCTKKWSLQAGCHLRQVSCTSKQLWWHISLTTANHEHFESIAWLCMITRQHQLHHSRWHVLFLAFCLHAISTLDLPLSFMENYRSDQRFGAHLPSKRHIVHMAWQKLPKDKLDRGKGGEVKSERWIRRRTMGACSILYQPCGVPKCGL